MSRIRLDPGAGDPAGLRELARDRRHRAMRIEWLSTTATAAAAHASGAAWTGEAREAFAEAVDASTPELTILSDSLHATADVLSVYADTVARIKDEQHDLERRRAGLEQEREELRHRWRTLPLDPTAPQFDDVTTRSETLQRELAAIAARLDDVQARWDALVALRGRADEDCAAALHSREVRGGLFAVLRADVDTAGERLERLGRLTASDLRALAAAHPDLLLDLRHARAEEVSEWWAGLSDSPAQQDLLIQHLAPFLAALGGLPARVRVAANRVHAKVRLASLRQELRRLRSRGYDTHSTQPYAVEAAAAAHLDRLRTLAAEIGYLDRVARGDVQLYLYEPRDERIIELVGDAHRADVILSVMPGTNTTMESFYTSSATHGITALAHWQVMNPSPDVDVAAFIVKSGRFPQLTDVWSEGPQHNSFAEPLGREYARFVDELRVITAGTPILSAEHSFGSSVGGEAEKRGAHFAGRFLLAGIGMTEGWHPQEGTQYYAAQGPMDINRALDDTQAGGLGYAITPAEIPDVSHIDTGYEDGQWAAGVAAVSPLVGIPAMLATALDQHNRLLSVDPKENGDVMEALRMALRKARS